MNNQFNLNFTTDLNRGASLLTLKMAFLEEDKQAHVFTVKTTKNGKENSLSGATVKGFFINQEEDVTVEIPGSVDEDGNAVVAFSDACYSFVGRFYFIIRATIDGVESSIFYAEGAVLRTKTGKIATTSATAPSLSALEERINNLTFSDVGAAPAQESENAPGCYFRSVGGYTEWINPPMTLGVEYRTTERWSGSPVFVKAIDLGSLPNGTNKSVEHGLTSNCTIVGFSGFAKSQSSSIVQMFPFISTTGTISGKIQVTATAVVVYAFADISTYTGHAVLWYIKT